MTDVETAAERRFLIKHMQAELKIVEASTARPPTPDPIWITLWSVTWNA